MLPGALHVKVIISYCCKVQTGTQWSFVNETKYKVNKWIKIILIKHLHSFSHKRITILFTWFSRDLIYRINQKCASTFSSSNNRMNKLFSPSTRHVQQHESHYKTGDLEWLTFLMSWIYKILWDFVITIILKHFTCCQRR